jgi:hypothetical protein
LSAAAAAAAPLFDISCSAAAAIDSARPSVNSSVNQTSSQYVIRRQFRNSTFCLASSATETIIAPLLHARINNSATPENLS